MIYNLPVINATDTTALRISLGLVVLYYKDEGWECHSFDVKAALLEPPMGETETYIRLPEGLVELGFTSEEEAKHKYIQLKNSMYSNVDAALRWIVLFTEYLTNKEISSMFQSRTDPCVIFKKSEDRKPLLIVVMTVDDCELGGIVEAINWLMTKVKERFKITQGGMLQKHLGVDYEW
jgi:hypothetical protein